MHLPSAFLVNLNKYTIDWLLLCDVICNKIQCLMIMFLIDRKAK